ncbi:hypothetical protein B0I35DRAFT_432730 [Stachybotrys elegans]|uniref:LCCL domain-containing protein n=1 Tax=Stachybotrys elegans TaxID=80388 RepID=A0A8K0SVR1_9HYPO|nr:hypothetical protein B0I35DRAFT_432730 [Stachybotrys elegans]
MDESNDENQPLMADRDRDDGDRAPDASAQHQRRNVNHDDGHPDAPLADAARPDDSDSLSSPTPRFIQDANDDTKKKWAWVPFPVRRVIRSAAQWTRGPPNPQPYRIKPFFPAVQEFPLRLVDRFLPKGKHRLWLVFVYLSLWLITFVLVARQGTRTSEIAGWGTPNSIGCGTTYWGAGNTCGQDGNDCRPFNNSGFPFTCPGNCESHHVLNPRAVGDQEIIYRAFVIGGPSSGQDRQQTFYRGDSFICGAAVHAGVISNSNGGCGVVRLIGQRDNFASTTQNGIESVGFDSYFPLSFEFVDDIACSATDNRWALFSISVVFLSILSLFTSSSCLFFFASFVGIFWTTGIATDPPPHSNITALFSNILGKFVPAMFCAWVMYDKMGVRRTLTKLTAQIEKTVLWLGACWVGALDNYTLSFIPIQRLTGHDLEQQPGARAALAIIVIVLFVIIVTQIWFFRQEGRFIKYIKLYALFIAGIVIALLLPGLNLRLHHYVLALLLLPGTSIQTRPSLLYQGLLIGLFINGIARWGFDPVLQTSAALQGDAQLGTELPIILTPDISMSNSSNIDSTSSITFTWEAPTDRRFDGISVLVNDVERFRAYFDDAFDPHEEFVWARNTTLELPEYFRFAFMDGSSNGDYTKAGIWTVDGEWQEMEAGPSRVKARSTGEEQRWKT